jgi:hypothetical protein
LRGDLLESTVTVPQLSVDEVDAIESQPHVSRRCLDRAAGHGDGLLPQGLQDPIGRVLAAPVSAQGSLRPALSHGLRCRRRGHDAQPLQMKRASL